MRQDQNAATIARGVAFLKAEAPKWTAERNAEATRALLLAASKGHDVGTSVDEMLAFLKQPASWDQVPAAIAPNKTLATIRFASALAVAERHGKAASTDLEAAAKLLVAAQDGGSWPVGDAQAIGSPVNYGQLVATWLARATLISSGMQPDNFTIVQTDKWIRGITPENVLEASATLLTLELASDVMAENLRRTCLSLLRQGLAADGGWGPEVGAAPQVFDTAMAILALSALKIEPRLARSAYRPEQLDEAIAIGKKYLVAQQKPDGSWPETTRPASKESYAQRISTTGWALQALLQ